MVQKLVEGFKGFKEGHYGDEGMMHGLFENGQKPEYFIISCGDSRADPATIFKSDPGTFFGFKAIGAIVRPYSKGTALSAELSFAINKLGVDKIIVLGHTNCGAVSALVNGIDDEEIASFVKVAHQGLERAKATMAFETAARPADLQSATEMELIHLSAQNLRTYPQVREALASGKMHIKEWLFDMQRGDLKEFNPSKGTFESMIEHPSWATMAPSGDSCPHDHNSVEHDR
jgi:carbonic anhydrase